MTFEIQGHRGARGLWPENTLAGFQAAIALGVASIETDVQRTRDDQLVLYHDFAISETICRRADESVPDPASRPAIRDLTLEQVKRYRADRNPDPDRFPAQQAEAGKDYTIPTLAEFLALGERAPGLIFDIEIKTRPLRGWNRGTEKGVVAAIRQAGVVGRARVRSFDHRIVRRVVDLEPGIEGAILVAGTAPVDAVQLAWRAGARVYCPDFEFVDPDLIEQCQAGGIRVLPWTVNDPADMEKLLAWGAAGITTDYPDRLRTAL